MGDILRKLAAIEGEDRTFTLFGYLDGIEEELVLKGAKGDVDITYAEFDTLTREGLIMRMNALGADYQLTAKARSILRTKW